MKMFTLSEMLSQLEESQFPEPKESMWLKTYSKKELEELIEAIDTHFIYSYSFTSFFTSKTAIEMDLFLKVREEILKQIML